MINYININLNTSSPKYYTTNQSKNRACRDMIAEKRKEEEKNKKETIQFFVSEIIRTKKNIERYLNSNNLKEQFYAKNSEKYLENLEKRMNEKFSKEEIEAEMNKHSILNKQNNTNTK